jgi:hypothetical protein
MTDSELIAYFDHKSLPEILLSKGTSKISKTMLTIIAPGIG